jgi:hypothetical protein
MSEIGSVYYKFNVRHIRLLDRFTTGVPEWLRQNGLLLLHTLLAG